MYGYIYLTTNTVSNKKYIGRRKGQFTDRYLGSGIVLKNAIKSYGRSVFHVEPLFYAFSNNDLNDAERILIREFQADSSVDFYNLAPGGNAWGSTKTKETRRKISEATKGRKAWNKGIPNLDAVDRMKKNNPMKDPAIASKVRAKLNGRKAWNKGRVRDKKPPVYKPCFICSIEFVVTYDRKLTCSRSCAATYSNFKRSGKLKYLAPTSPSRTG